MQDRAKANHDLGKDAMINHVLDNGSMVASPFFANSYFLTLHFSPLRSMASSLLALPRYCHDLVMILARIPWPCKIVQRLIMILVRMP